MYFINELFGFLQYGQNTGKKKKLVGTLARRSKECNQHSCSGVGPANEPHALDNPPGSVANSLASWPHRPPRPANTLLTAKQMPQPHQDEDWGKSSHLVSFLVFLPTKKPQE